MHVALICDEYPPGVHGGIGSLTQTVARRIVGAGHRATVVGTYRPSPDRRDEGNELDEGVQVIRLDSRGRVPIWRAVADQRRLWKRIDQIHASDPIDVLEGPEPSLWAAPRRPGFPTIVRMHGGHRFFAEAEGRPTAPGRRWVEARSIRRADDLVAVSDHTARRTSTLLGLDGRPITVIPNPVDVHAFRPGARPVVPGLVVFVGTVCEKKGVRQLVDSFPAVVARVPHARLLVVGRDQTDPATGGSFTARLQASIPPELAERVVFAGPVAHDQVADLVAQAEVCALPSHMEAMPMAWIEVLAAGKALVASSTGPGPEVVEHGVSGLLVDPHDPEAIAGALVAVLTDPACRDRLGAAARQRAVDRFSIDELIQVNLDHYRLVRERWQASGA
jgi:glycosyltransferase involved in cell wall biosynthesis